MALSWFYRDQPHSPFWGPITSQANFCEEDYIITTYIAEVINTLSNFIYLFYALHGIKNNANRKDAVLRNLPYLGIAGVGFGSAIFHATLKNYTQWCDDLSMLIATTTVLHRVFTFDQTLNTTIISGISLTAFMTAFIAWHCITDEIIMHSVLFGVMIALIGIKTRSIIARRVQDKIVRKEVFKLCTWGGVIFVTGFIIWNIDTAICNTLTQTKRAIGMPLSFLLELHGWWHIFTGLGAYIFIALVEYLTSDEAGQALGNRFAWPVGMIVKANVEKKTMTMNGHSNGHAKMNGNGNGVANGKKTL